MFQSIDQELQESKPFSQGTTFIHLQWLRLFTEAFAFSSSFRSLFPWEYLKRRTKTRKNVFKTGYSRISLSIVETQPCL